MRSLNGASRTGAPAALRGSMDVPGACAAEGHAVIGYLHFASPRTYSDQLADFRLGLSQSGYVEGQNVRIEYGWADDRYDRLSDLAADLVSHKVAVIVAISGAPARAAKAATSTIPIIFMTGSDPVANGLAASLARPGGHLTGVSFLFGELHAKRLDCPSLYPTRRRSPSLWTRIFRRSRLCETWRTRRVLGACSSTF